MLSAQINPLSVVVLLCGATEAMGRERLIFQEDAVGCVTPQPVLNTFYVT